MEDDAPYYNSSLSDDGQSLDENPSDALPDVSTKNTKAEIMQAYNDITKRYEANLKSKKAVKAKKSAEEQMVEQASVHTVTNVTRSLEQLKADLARGVDALAATLVEESRKMEEVEGAIRIL